MDPPCSSAASWLVCGYSGHLRNVFVTELDWLFQVQVVPHVVGQEDKFPCWFKSPNCWRIILCRMFMYCLQQKKLSK